MNKRSDGLIGNSGRETRQRLSTNTIHAKSVVHGEGRGIDNMIGAT
jgi:hypothetical protein